MTRHGILYRLAAAAMLAGAAHVLFVLPAEFHKDPTGFGAATGLLALSGPPPAPAPVVSTPTAAIAYTSPVPFRTDTIQVKLEGDAQTEYKIRMKTGARMVYSWTVHQGQAYWDFHGEPHTDPEKSQSYETGTGPAANGGLTAPMDGIHGWLFLNQEGHPIVITVKMSGFYELIAK